MAERIHTKQKTYPVSLESHPFPEEAKLLKYPPYSILQGVLNEEREMTLKKWFLTVFIYQQADALGLVETEHGKSFIPDDALIQVLEPLERIAEIEGLKIRVTDEPDTILVGDEEITFRELFLRTAVDPKSLTTREEIDPEQKNRAIWRNTLKLTTHIQEASLLNKKVKI